MSLVQTTFSTPPLSGPRKRTTSFSCSTSTFTPSPRPSKVPRTTMGSLRRTESCVTLPGFQTSPSASSSQAPIPQPDCSSHVPYHRTLRFYKEQRERRKALLGRHLEPITIRTKLEVTFTAPTIKVRLPKPNPSPPSSSRIPAPAPHPAPHHAPKITSNLRSSSPLAPTRTILPGRPAFPRSKPEPDLYRKAITTRMRSSPEGQKILHMGPRLAVSIMTATRELERIVAQAEKDTDVAMSDTTPVMSNSWVVVPGEDWEMIDCAACRNGDSSSLTTTHDP